MASPVASSLASSPAESCETAAIGSATGRFAQFMSRTPLVNREIGWLSFNERVLQEAADPEVPLIEPQFVICSSSLEELLPRSRGHAPAHGRRRHQLAQDGVRRAQESPSFNTEMVPRSVGVSRPCSRRRAALENEGISIVDEEAARRAPRVRAEILTTWSGPASSRHPR